MIAELMIIISQRWEYMHNPKPETPEGKLIEVLKNPREWLENTEESEQN